MKTICLNFNLHKSVLLKKYRFFDIGNDNNYFDKFTTDLQTEIDAKSYIMPLFKMMEQLSNEYKDKFKCSITMSGIAMENFTRAFPEGLRVLRELAQTGNFEITGMPYYHSLTSITDKEELAIQVKKHSDKIYELFGVTPTAFRNTELIYSDEIGRMLYDLGFDTILTEGCGKAIELYGPNVLYFNPTCETQKIITRNQDYSRMFQDGLKNNKLFTPEYFAEKFYDFEEEDEVIYLGVNFSNFLKTEYHNSEVELVKFLKSFVSAIVELGEFVFETPSGVSKNHTPTAPLNVPRPISGMNRYHDLTPWRSNELQEEAIMKITSYAKLVKEANSEVLTDIWRNLQSSDYFYYMSTDFFNNPTYGYKPNPFKSPYEAFINYMNIISDLERRLKEKIKEKERETLTNEEIKDIIKHYESVITDLKQKLDNRTDE